MEIVNRSYSDWSSEIRKRLRDLSFRGSGSMCRILSTNKCDTFVAIENNVIIGWAAYSLQPWFTKIYIGDLMIYVRKTYRRRGIGKMLIKEAVKKYGSVRVHPWNMTSGYFFATISGIEGVKLERYGKKWVDYAKQIS